MRYVFSTNQYYKTIWVIGSCELGFVRFKHKDIKLNRSYKLEVVSKPKNGKAYFHSLLLMKKWSLEFIAHSPGGLKSTKDYLNRISA